MKALKVLTLALVATFSVTAVNAQMRHRKHVVVVRHHHHKVIVRHHRP
jgi:hypothetical protein